MSNRRGSYGGYGTPRGYDTPRRGNNSGRGQFGLPPPMVAWGNPGYGRTQEGFRARPGDGMVGSNFWHPRDTRRDFYPPRGYHDVSTPYRGHGRSGGRSQNREGPLKKNKTKSRSNGDEDKEKEENTRNPSEKEKSEESFKRNHLQVLEDLGEDEKVMIGERLKRDGTLLFKIPETEEDKQRISGAMDKFFSVVRCELGDETFVNMFRGTQPSSTVQNSEEATGGACGGEPEEVIEKEVSTRPKEIIQKEPYVDEALDRLKFFNEEGDQKETSDIRRDSADKRNQEEVTHPSINNKSLGKPKPMTEQEKAMVNTVIGDIVDGRTEYGEWLWRDIRERGITDHHALSAIALFFRRQYNEGITKQQAEYCCIKLQNRWPKKKDEEKAVEEDQLAEENQEDWFEDEVLDRLSRLAYDGDKEEAKKASLKKSRSILSDSQDIVPRELLDYKVGSFANMEDYMYYMKEVTKRMVENVAIVEEKCKVNAVNDRKRAKERRETSERVGREPYGSSETAREQTVSSDRTGPRVGFEPTSGNGDGTYTLGGRRGPQALDGPRRGGRYSTPNAPRPRVNPNQDDSMWSDNIGLTARELSIYEQYDVPMDIRRPSRMTETSSPLLSSTVVGEQTTGNMQSLFSMVPTGSSQDMFRKFTGFDSEFLEWKHETSILLKNFPEELRPIKLKSLLKEEHKKLVGHIFHDDVNATDKMWAVLTKNFGRSMSRADYHMDKLTGWMRDGRRCHDYESLSHLYNFIKTHYYGIARLGAEKIPMAESFAYAIAPLLYGKSQREVNKLKHKDVFNVNKILDIIADHANEVKAQEEDKEKYEHRSEQYSEEDKKFLRERYFEEKGYSHDYKYKRYSKDYRSKYGSPEKRYYRDRDSSSDRSYKEVNRYHRNRYNSRERSYENRYKDYRSSSRDRSRYNSQDRYRNDSQDRYKHGTQSYSGNRSYSSERESGDEKKRYYKKDNYKKEQKRFSRDRYRRDEAEHDQEPVVLKTEVGEESHDEERPRYRRSRDQTPRGSRSKSPIRRPSSRSWNSWSCTLCLKDDHKTINCRNYTAEEVNRLCNERKLCFVCNLTGHMASVCNAENLFCKSSSCRQDVKHNNLLCEVYKRT